MTVFQSLFEIKLTLVKTSDATLSIKNTKNDIAIIKLDRDVVKSENNGFVCITKSSQVAPGEAVTAVGWGYTEFSRNQGLFLFMIYLIKV